MADEEEFFDADELDQQAGDDEVDEEERDRRKAKRKQLIVDPDFAAFHFAPKKPPPKKLIIKKFRNSKNNGEETFQKSWTLLSQSIDAIQCRRGVSSTLEHLYQTVENLCIEKKASEAYNKLGEKLSSFLTAQCEAMRGRGEFDGIVMLTALDVLWENYCAQMDAIQSIFLVLDRMHVLHERSLQPIYEMGLTMYHTVVLDRYGLGPRIGKVIVEQITIERKGDKINTSLIRSILRMLHALNVYGQFFEREFLSATTEFYREESERLCQEMDTPTYLTHVATRLREEEMRCDMYLVHTTRTQLLLCGDAQLIDAQMETFVKKGTGGLLEHARYLDLRLMYELLGRISTGRNLLRTVFADYIKKHGRSLVNDAARDATMVKDLMEFKQRMDSCIAQSFRGDEKFAQSEKDAFDFFINTRPNRPAELIAKFMDARLRAGNKESSEEELDTVMDRAVHIFRFIQGKDVFEAFYKRDLAKRLLLGRSASTDAEKAMLSKLRAECGPGFTHKLEGMFKDMDVSQSLNQAFRQYCTTHSVTLRPDLTVSVLTMGMWPKYEPSEVIIPAELNSCLQSFSSFYTQKHNGRKLQWQHSLGQALLKATFDKGVSKELQVSLFQANVLLLFNDKVEWAFDEIKAATKIEEKELCRTLQSLACAKYKVLVKEPKGREVEKTDKFVFNTTFREKLYRIRICQVQMKEAEKEKQQTEDEVSQDRLYQIDAALVRVMKTRKTLAHQQLIQELFSQLRFPVKAVDLKKRIASLIERDYMHRDSNDSNIYHYVA